MDFWIRFALSVLFGVLEEVVKNPGKKAAIKKAMVKLRKALTLSFPPEAD